MPSDRQMIIDVHAHLYPLEYLKALSDPDSPVVAVPDGDEYDLMVGGHRFVRVTRQFFDPEERLRAMDAAGITTQVLTLSPPMVYWATPERSIELCRVVNDAFAALATAHPDRFIAGGILPLLSPDAAVEEISRIKGLGHRMVVFPTHIAGIDLDDKSLDPVYRALVEADLPIFVHPIMPRVADSMKRDRFDPLLGFTTETTYAATRVISGGVFDRHPDLRFCWSHLGGALPYLADRVSYLSVQGSGDFPGIGGAPASPHDDYLSKYWFDTVVYSDRTLRYGAEFAGVDRLLFGTDCPFFDDTSAQQRQLIEKAQWLTNSERERIFSNTHRFLRPA